MANAVVEMGVEVIFLTVPDLLDWLRASFSGGDETFEQRLDEIRNVRLLVLDDLALKTQPLGGGETVPDHQSSLYSPPADR